MLSNYYALVNGVFAACEEVMAILDECHARGFMWKVMGMCNGAKTNVNKCLRAQRLERTKANREAAKVKRAQIEAKWAEIDENS
jgi:COX assembly mitochondrial protein 2